MEDKIFRTEWLQAFPDFCLLLISARSRHWIKTKIVKFIVFPSYRNRFHRCYFYAMKVTLCAVSQAGLL
jgi:hypothetical protein